MSVKNEKIKIAFSPNLQFESFAGTMIDKDRFEIVPLSVVDHKSVEKYGQKVFGEWCFPIKLHVAMYEKAIVEKGVSIILAMIPKICSYPLIIANLNNSIKTEFSFYPLFFKKVCIKTGSFLDLLKHILKINGRLFFFSFIKRLPVAIWKTFKAAEMMEYYLENIPKTKNPVLYKKEFISFKTDFIVADTFESGKESIKKFEEITKKSIIKKENRFRVLMSGDMAILLSEFSVFDLDIYLAKHGVRLVNPLLKQEFCFIKKFKKFNKNSKKLLNQVFSSENKKMGSDNHTIEIDTIAQIFEGLETNIDGIIYIKPNMCAPSEHVSYILKQKKFFDLPFVELTYDEHSGLNGLVTRLEAFLNIIEERMGNKVKNII